MRASGSRSVLLAVLCAAALIGSGGASALAAPNEVAYRCGLDICLLDPDNPSAVANLTDNGEASYDEMPAWSPDGKRVAFVSRFPGSPDPSRTTRNVYVMEPDATGNAANIALQVTHFADGGYLGGPVWSPDGTKIAFVRGPAENNRSVQVASADGTTATPVVVAEHGQHPSWAPDGGKIAYSYLHQVYLRNADASGVATPLENGGGDEPVWSPDGSKIALDLPLGVFGVDLQIVPAAGGASPTVLTSGAQWTFSAFSPSGAQIVYEALKAAEANWRVTNADGSGDHPLAAIKELNPNGPAPSFSPDGARIVYQGYYYAEMKNTTEVYISNTDGSGSVTALTGDDSHEPAWRPRPAIVPPQVISNGSSAPITPTIAPKTVWITKRIPWTPGPNLNIIVGVYGCDAPSCNVGTQGSARYVGPPSLLYGLRFASASSGPRYKPRKVIVARGSTTIPGGQSRPLKMKLTKAGRKLLLHRGSLTFSVTVTVTIPGRAKKVEHRQASVFVKKPLKKKAHRG